MLRRNFAPLALTAFAALLIAPPSSAPAQSPAEARRMREALVRDEIKAAGVEDERVLNAIRETPRHEFVPLAQRKYAYLDMALPIGERQTISPPFVVAYMTEQLNPEPSDKVLEIGTGSGYQAAVLSPLVAEVYSIEIVRKLGLKAGRTLKRLRYKNVKTRIGDGYLGWPEAAPFDKIIVTCSPDKVPQPLIDQLREGGQMIVPVGERFRQNLYRMTKVDGRLQREVLRATLFVPMTGEAEENRDKQPDPTRPEIVNGSFESLLGKSGLPEGWHYLRRGEVVTDRDEARDGNAYLQFKNDEPGQPCQALQGFPIDGRKVSRLNVSFAVRGKAIRYGQNRQQWPRVVVTFYDERRAAIDNAVVGPFSGDFEWTEWNNTVGVPLKAREAIVRIGMLGAIGELAIDDLRIAAERGR
ncbi:MAG: protein-L-isoaspartate(D-aspartate) O-methyltransferase [Planctomycetota bacterium]